ncbi:MAG: hypothetical protein E7597_06820 [Ruminococcaceae bacterium]|nr:hypothetical protein [Oscillospiraceae bacterium]
MSSRRRLLMLENALPLEYILRTNISCNGSIYFDTGYLVHSSDRIEICGRVSTAQKNGVFGVESSSGNSFYFINDGKNAIVGHGHLTSECQGCISTDISNFVFYNSGLSVDDTVLITPFSNKEFKSDLPLFIGAINKNGTPCELERGTFYYLKIYNAKGVLIRSFVPCTRNSDGEQGLYELVYQRFHPKISV